MTRPRARCLVLACGLMLVSACATVAPYERERLSKRDMIDDTRELRASEQHAHDYREGAHGNLDSTGGGCGCN